MVSNELAACPNCGSPDVCFYWTITNRQHPEFRKVYRGVRCRACRTCAGSSSTRDEAATYWRDGHVYWGADKFAVSRRATLGR